MLTEQAESALRGCNSASYKITDKGLEFTVDAQTQHALRLLAANEENGEPVGFHTDELFLELIEHCLCNGLSPVRPEDIGASTSSLLFSEGDYGLVGHNNGKDIYGADHVSENPAPVFWYGHYQVRSPIEDLADYGNVIFTE